MADITGRVFVIAAASGTGKTSLVTRLLADVPTLHFSVSHTTRPARAHEINGQHYHFVTPAQFLAMQQAGEFVESAYVHGNYYGTSQVIIQQQIDAGQDVLLEIDWQGARQLKSIWPELVSVFVLPPSFAELARRLHTRGQDSEEVIAQRLAIAHDEMAHFDEFDHWLVNDDFDATYQQLRCLIDR